MKNLLFTIVILCLMFVGCKKTTTGPDSNASSIKVEWITPSGGETQYEKVRNNANLVVGLRFRAEFEVIENSGNITVKIKLVDDDTNLEESISKDVSEGNKYLVSVYSDITGTTSCPATSIAATVTFSSTSTSNDKEKTVLNWVGSSMPYAPYCVNLNGLSDVSITAL